MVQRLTWLCRSGFNSKFTSHFRPDQSPLLIEIFRSSLNADELGWLRRDLDLPSISRSVVFSFVIHGFSRRALLSASLTPASRGRRRRSAIAKLSRGVSFLLRMRGGFWSGGCSSGRCRERSSYSLRSSAFLLFSVPLSTSPISLYAFLASLDAWLPRQRLGLHLAKQLLPSLSGVYEAALSPSVRLVCFVECQAMAIFFSCARGFRFLFFFVFFLQRIRIGALESCELLCQRGIRTVV